MTTPAMNPVMKPAMKSAMKPLMLFSAAALIPWLAAAIWVFVQRDEASPSWLRPPPLTPAYFLMLVGIPGLLQWLTADVIDRIRPRLFLQGKARRWTSSASRGLFAGALALASTGALAPFMEPQIQGIWIVAMCSVFWTAVFMLTSARARVNHCGGCNYDLIQTPATAPCPECGKKYSRIGHV